MQKNILQKCIEELKKPACRIDYVIGMLETLVEMDSTSVPLAPYMPSYPSIPMPTYSLSAQTTNVPHILTDEERNAQIYAAGPVGNVGTV